MNKHRADTTSVTPRPVTPRPITPRHATPRPATPRPVAMAVVGLTALLALVAVLGYVGLHRTDAQRQVESTATGPAGSAVVAAPASQIENVPTLLVISDSYAAGVGGQTFETYAPRVADEMGWNLRLDAIGGSGFVESVKDGNRVGRPFRLRLPEDIEAYQPDYVLVDGGRNDLDKPMDLVVPAIESFLDDVRTAWPKATIIVMKPQMLNPWVHPNYELVSGVIDAVAARNNELTIDPVAQGWYRDIDIAALTISDHVHPNDAGAQFYADHVVDALKSLGIEPTAQAKGRS